MVAESAASSGGAFTPTTRDEIVSTVNGTPKVKGRSSSRAYTPPSVIGPVDPLALPLGTASAIRSDASSVPAESVTPIPPLTE